MNPNDDKDRSFDGVPLDALPERVRLIATLRGLGYSFREIGAQFDVTPQGASVILARHRRSLKQLKDSIELHGLSARAANALGRHGIRSREQARRTDVMHLLRNERNCGRKTCDEIGRWIADGDTAQEGRIMERC